MTGKELLPLIHAKGRGDRMSENLYKWVRKHGDPWLTVGFAQKSVLDGKHVSYDKRLTQTGQILIGFADPTDRDFFCCKLGNILGSGAKADTYALSLVGWDILFLPEWWQGYTDRGKCFIDPEHRLYQDKERWQVADDGNSRECLWCGNHRQKKRVEMVPREHWDSVTDLVMRGEGR